MTLRRPLYGGMSFTHLGLDDRAQTVLEGLKIVDPSPVQRLVVPAILGGASVVAVAQTGSGKTYAYGLPLLQRLRGVEDAEGKVEGPGRPRGLVLTGTRELVEQTTRALKAVAHPYKLRVRGVAGGQKVGDARRTLSEAADVLVANPPRLRKLLEEGAVKLDDVRVVVVDEADTLLAPGQRPDVEALFAATPTAQRVYVSATLPEPVRAWLATRPEHPTLLMSKDAHLTPERVRIQNLHIRMDQRADKAFDVIGEREGRRGIVFTNRRETAEQAAEALGERGAAVILCHGGMLPGERKAAFDRWRKGEAPVLVTTELVGRGIHLEGLDYVLNYELPGRASDYVHRVGRVGRQGARGEVINLVGPKDQKLLAEINRLDRGGKLDTGEALRHARVRGGG